MTSPKSAKSAPGPTLPTAVSTAVAALNATHSQPGETHFDKAIGLIRNKFDKGLIAEHGKGTNVNLYFRTKATATQFFAIYTPKLIFPPVIATKPPHKNYYWLTINVPDHHAFFETMQRVSPPKPETSESQKAADQKSNFDLALLCEKISDQFGEKPNYALKDGFVYLLFIDTDIADNFEAFIVRECGLQTEYKKRVETGNGIQVKLQSSVALAVYNRLCAEQTQAVKPAAATPTPAKPLVAS